MSECEAENAIVARTATRLKVRQLLPDIAVQSKAVLRADGIEFDLFFIVPYDGETILRIGTIVEPDPADEVWEKVGATVAEIAGRLIGEKLRHSELPPDHVATTAQKQNR